MRVEQLQRTTSFRRLRGCEKVSVSLCIGRDWGLWLGWACSSAARAAELLSLLRRAAASGAAAAWGIVPQLRVHAVVGGFLETPAAIYRNLAVTCALLFLVAAFMIRTLFGAAAVFASLVSINLGVLGLGAHWGVAVDNVSAIVYLMCAGFAVNLVAHFAHAADQAIGSPEERVSPAALINPLGPSCKRTGPLQMTEALRNFGTPIFLGGFSSLLGNFFLFTHTHYFSKVRGASSFAIKRMGTFHLEKVFCRCVLICVASGLFHALFLLPVFLATVHEMYSNYAPFVAEIHIDQISARMLSEAKRSRSQRSSRTKSWRVLDLIPSIRCNLKVLSEL